MPEEPDSLPQAVCLSRRRKAKGIASPATRLSVTTPSDVVPWRWRGPQGSEDTHSPTTTRTAPVSEYRGPSDPRSNEKPMDRREKNQRLHLHTVNSRLIRRQELP